MNLTKKKQAFNKLPDTHYIYIINDVGIWFSKKKKKNNYAGKSNQEFQDSKVFTKEKTTLQPICPHASK